MSGWVTRVLLVPVRLYQRFISPVLPASCRYYPSCSAYAVTALEIHGPIKGSLLTVWRLLRCNPLTPGGVEHVPDKGCWRYHHPRDVPRFRVERSDRSSQIPATGWCDTDQSLH